MKNLLVLFMVSWLHATAASLEEVSPHFSTEAEIVWKVPAEELPKRLWIYEKSRHVFSPVTISNAIVLAGFQQKGFPKGLTKTVILADHMEGEPQPPSFLIMPENGTIQYDLGDRWPNSLQDILADQAAVEYAWDCLALLGIDRKQFVKTNIASFGVAFPRQIDGIRFQDESEGFSLEQFGKERKLRGFGLTLPTLHRTKEDTTASPEEIIACIRAFKTPLVPSREEADYLGRVKNTAKAGTLTITKLTPYYGEGVYG
jgi:hypothetical protein